jgi:hypothetical protein
MAKGERLAFVALAIVCVGVAFWQGGIGAVVLVVVAALLYPMKWFLAIRNYHAKNGEPHSIVEDLREAYDVFGLRSEEQSLTRRDGQ